MKMYFFLIFLFGSLVAGAIIYSFPPYRQAVIKAFSYSQCDTPLPYKIGSIDPRYNLSQSDVQSDIQSATVIWDKAEGKELFRYDPSAQLVVNFVYDQRQELDNTINQLQSQLDQKNSALRQQIQDYQKQVTDYEAKLQEFNQTVDHYNQLGGAPKDVYDNLTQQQTALRAEGEVLNTKAKELNLSTIDFNTQVSSLNQDVNQFNSAITQKPEEGLYDGQANTITIYLINNQNELVHTLAHEFGHSLGMQHVSDLKAIMYPYTNDSISPSIYDLQQLQYVCRSYALPIHWAVVFDTWIYSVVQTVQHQYLHKTQMHSM